MYNVGCMSCNLLKIYVQILKKLSHIPDIWDIDKTTVGGMDIRLPFVAVEKKQARYLTSGPWPMPFCKAKTCWSFHEVQKKRSLAHSFFFSQNSSDLLNLLGLHFDCEKHELTMFVLIRMDGWSQLASAQDLGRPLYSVDHGSKGRLCIRQAWKKLRWHEALCLLNMDTSMTELRYVGF